MRLFLYEYTCAAGAKHAGSASLSMEGAAMLRAMVEDFRRLPNVEIATLLIDCFPEDLGDRCRRVTPEQEPAAFRQLAAWADFTLVIAPEFDDLLATRCGWVGQAGGRLLGPSPEAVQPYCRGLPASVACLIGPTQVVPLLPAAQHLSTDGRCRYLGGSLPLPRALAERAVRLGLRVVQALAGLGGYVGVDLVLGDEP